MYPGPDKDYIFCVSDSELEVKDIGPERCKQQRIGVPGSSFIEALTLGLELLNTARDQID